MRDFTLVGRQTSGTSVIGYMVMDNRTGKVQSVDKNTVYNLALNKRIEGVIAQEYMGRITMKGVHTKISSLPEYDKEGNLIKSTDISEGKKRLYITYKVIDGKTTLGYGVDLYNQGRIISKCVITREQLIQFARAGTVINARCQTSNGKDILRGVGCNIAELPSVNYSDLCEAKFRNYTPQY